MGFLICTGKPGNEASCLVQRYCIAHELYTEFSQVSAHGQLKFTGQKKGVGTYMEKPFVHIKYTHMNHRIIKKQCGIGTYKEMGTYSGDYGTCLSQECDWDPYIPDLRKWTLQSIVLMPPN